MKRWLWAALALQFAGLAFDGLWHGLLRPGVEPTTFTDMLVHLGTVHLPLYLAGPQRADHYGMGIHRAQARITDRLRRRAAVDSGRGLARVHSSQAEYAWRPDR
jgi:hypothetical protein